MHRRRAGLAQPGTHLREQQVARAMAKAVVHILEPVEVQHQERLATARRIDQAGVPLGVEGPPVRQPGQLVGGSSHEALLRHPFEKPVGQLGARTAAASSAPAARPSASGDTVTWLLTTSTPTPATVATDDTAMAVARVARARRESALGLRSGGDVDPGGHEREPDRPSGIQRRAEHIGVLTSPAARRPRPWQRRPAGPRPAGSSGSPMSTSAQGRDPGDEGDEHEVEHRWPERGQRRQGRQSVAELQHRPHHDRQHRRSTQRAHCAIQPHPRSQTSRMTPNRQRPTRTAAADRPAGSRHRPARGTAPCRHRSSSRDRACPRRRRP